jgi:hypothetical protein
LLGAAATVVVRRRPLLGLLGVSRVSSEQEARAQRESRKSCSQDQGAASLAQVSTVGRFAQKPFEQR